MSHADAPAVSQKELLRKKLIERGWRDELKEYCKEVSAEFSVDTCCHTTVSATLCAGGQGCHLASFQHCMTSLVRVSHFASCANAGDQEQGARGHNH